MTHGENYAKHSSDIKCGCTIIKLPVFVWMESEKYPLCCWLRPNAGKQVSRGQGLRNGRQGWELAMQNGYINHRLGRIVTVKGIYLVPPRTRFGGI